MRRQTKQSGPQIVESFETRVLLSSVWAGTWKLSMSTMGVESHRWGVGTYAESKTMKLTITDSSAGHYHISVPAVGFEADLVDDPAYPGSGLKADVFGPDNEDPDEDTELYMRLQMADPGVMFVSVQDVAYGSLGLDRISWAGASGGLATKTSVPVTTVPWTGTYPVYSYTTEVEVGYHSHSSVDSSQVVITAAGKNLYTAGSTNGGTPNTFKASGSTLKHSTAIPLKLPDGTDYESEVILRGPYGRLYHLGIIADCDGGSINSVSLDASWTDPITQIAPTLDKYGSPFLGAIAQDAASNAGTRISDLLANGGSNYVYDANDANSLGIALTGADTKHGTWQFSTDGSTWQLVGKVSASQALLLAPDARLRFVPKTGFNGTLAKAITFRAWDQTPPTSGANGTLVKASPSGKFAPFSSATDTASLIVTPISSPRVLSGFSIPLTNHIDARVFLS